MRVRKADGERRGAGGVVVQGWLKQKKTMGGNERCRENRSSGSNQLIYNYSAMVLLKSLPLNHRCPYGAREAKNNAFNLSNYVLSPDPVVVSQRCQRP